MKTRLLVILASILCAYSAQANMLSDGSFEACTDEYNFDTSPWNGWGDFRNQSWAAHTGNRGAFIPGWSASNGGVWQSGAASETGTYTLVMWILREPGLNSTNIEMKLEFYAPDDVTKVQGDVVTNVSVVPGDGLWHHVHVSGVATSTILGYVRAVIFSEWGAPLPDSSACMIDDVEMYYGEYTGTTALVNMGFEDGQFESWRGSSWGAWRESHWGRIGWAARSGSQGIHLAGWHWTEVVTNEPGGEVVTNIVAPKGITNVMSQSVTLPSTGTYSFAVWMSRESDFTLNSSELRIEFLDQGRSNKVQDDAVQVISVPNDNTWREYYVVGTLTNTDVYEIRPVIQMGWDRTTNDGGKAMRIDDARFWKADYDGVSVKTDWAYHAAPGYNQMMEQVPGGGALGTFLQVDHDTNTNTFYALSDRGELAKYDGENAALWIRTSWRRPDTGDWVDTDSQMTLVGSAEIPSGTPFHGLPVSGTTTVDVWRHQASQPSTTGGDLYAENAIRIYYAPYIKPTNALFETGRQYLIYKNGDGTNNVGQLYGTSPFDRDYSFDNLDPHIQPAFTNGGFENPEGMSTLSNSGWYGIGELERTNWAARSGNAGMAFTTWNAGSWRVMQDVACTGGLYSFSGYVKIEPAVTNLSRAGLRMEWYSADHRLLAVNEQSLLGLDRSYDWQAASVVGACYDVDTAYVRLSMDIDNGLSDDVPGRATMLDDAEFRELSGSPQNASFESDFAGSGWMAVGNLNREMWGAREGVYVLGFHGWSPGHALAYQDISVSTGAYKFSTWAKLEPGATNVSELSIRMEWYADDGTLLQVNEQDLLDMPRTYEWEQVYVVGACDDPDLAYVRLSLAGVWGATDLAGTAAMFDALQFVQVGSTLQNAGFEVGSNENMPYWYAWSLDLARVEPWANHEVGGTNGVAFRGWIKNGDLHGRYETTLEQPLVVTQGTYEFSIWIARDSLFTLTNGELRIEWYGDDYPNKIQADTAVSFTVPGDAAWYYYAITGECANANVRFAKPVVFAQWDAAADQALKMDEVTFQSTGSPFTDGIPNTWWDRYGVAPGDRVASDYPPSGNPSTYLENYYADSDPTDANSYFRGVGAFDRTGLGTAWSTNTRTYYISFKTNLMDSGPWADYGVEVVGDGNPLTLTITNDAPMRFYRMGVKP